MINRWPAERVRELRLRLGLTQAEFAEIVGAGRAPRVATISAWETGEVKRIQKRFRDRLNELDELTGPEDLEKYLKRKPRP